MTTIGEVREPPIEQPLTVKRSWMWTALGSVLAILLVMPASYAGMLARFIYLGAFNFMISGTWIPFIAEIGGAVFPQIVMGVVTGALAVGVTRIIIRKANIKLVARFTAVAWLLLYAVEFGLRSYLDGASMDLVTIVSLMIGMAMGIFGASQE